jgi:hypothetical protein
MTLCVDSRQVFVVVVVVVVYFVIDSVRELLDTISYNRHKIAYVGVAENVVKQAKKMQKLYNTM